VNMYTSINMGDYLMRYEQGDLSFDEMLLLFQFLLDSGMIHVLQGSYQRTAVALIEDGYIE
jgi:hypothetical protein